MLEAKYLEKFNKLGLRKELFQLRGDRILLEMLPKEDLTTESGIYIATDINYRSSTKENQATLGVVLLVGEGYYDEETGADKPLDIKPGNIVLLSSMGLKYYSSFPGIQGYVPNTLALSRDSEVHMIIPNFEAYEQMKGVLR